jgi:hypothetical protein
MLVVLIVASGRGAAAQVDASLGLGVGTVRFPDTTSGGQRVSFSSTTFSPAFRYASSAVALDFTGSIASLPNAGWSSQGRADLWGTTAPLRDGLRLAGEGIVAGTTHSHGEQTAAASGLAELLWSAPAWGFGVGAGPSSGWIGDSLPVVALHTRARAWWRPPRDAGYTEWQVSLEPTHFLGEWFTDAAATVTLERGSAVVSLSTSARLLGTVAGSKAAASAFVQVFLAPTVSLELGGGSVLNDPYQGLPRAGFVTLGVRLHASPRARRVALDPAWPPLVPERRGDSLVVRFRMEGARAVAIAGDWNAWRPVALRRVRGSGSVGGDEWEGTLLLRRGLYHFNLQVDGREWVVPSGVATVPDGLGGMVAVLIVP